MSVGSEINQYILDNGMKKSYIAKQAGLKIDAFSRILRGHQKVGVDEYMRICQALDVPLTKFLDSDTEKEDGTHDIP